MGLNIKTYNLIKAPGINGLVQRDIGKALKSPGNRHPLKGVCKVQGRALIDQVSWCVQALCNMAQKPLALHHEVFIGLVDGIPLKKCQFRQMTLTALTLAKAFADLKNFICPPGQKSFHTQLGEACRYAPWDVTGSIWASGMIDGQRSGVSTSTKPMERKKSLVSSITRDLFFK